MNNGQVDVEGILNLCSLKGLSKKDHAEIGWRAASPAKEKDDKESLVIFKTGSWHDHFTQESGFITDLYARIIGKDKALVRARLIQQGFLPRGYRPVEPENPFQKIEESEKKATLEGLRTVGIDWGHISKWRGVPWQAFQACADSGSMGIVDAYPGLGTSVAFVSTSPPMEGVPGEVKMTHLRSVLPETKDWRTVGTYGVWVPKWNPAAEKVYLVEGQWDAIALQAAFDGFLKEADVAKIQVMALASGKVIDKHPELMDWLSSRTVIQIPDSDEPGNKFLIQTWKALQKVDCNHRLQRILDGKGKDFNDWYKKGISKEDFEMWMDCDDDFRVAGGSGREVVIDTAFREKHGLKLGASVDINDEGDPVEVFSNRVQVEEPVSVEEFMELISEFPLLHDYVLECMTVQEAPPMWHGVSFLTYMGGAIGRRLKFSSGAEGILYPNLYSLLVGPSAMGKGQSMRMLQPILSKTNPNLTSADGYSAEAFLESLEESPQKMLLFEEFAEWMGAREGNYRHGLMGQFIKLYDAQGYSSERPYEFRFRTKGKSIKINEPIFSILAACTDGQTSFSDGSMLRNGLVGRFIFCLGSKKSKSVPMPGKITQSLRQRMEDFYRGISITPNRTNCAMRFSNSAMEMYREAYAHHEEWLSTRDFSGDMLTYTGRWRVQVLKFAMLFQLLSVEKIWPLQNSDVIISDRALLAAIKFVTMLERNFFQLFETQFNSGESFTVDTKIRRAILRFMNTNSGDESLDGVSKTALLRSVQVSARVLDENLNTMVEAGELVKRDIRLPGKTGRPKTVYLLVKNKKIENYEFKPQKISKASSRAVNGSSHANGHEGIRPNTGSSTEGAGSGSSQELELSPSAGSEGPAASGDSPVEDRGLGQE